MVLVTLNSSIDVPDYLLYHHLSKSRSASVNEMESIAELVTECMTDSSFEFDEQRNDDSNSHSLTKKIAPAKYRQDIPEFALLNGNLSATLFVITGYLSDVIDVIHEITPPPPKA